MPVIKEIFLDTQAIQAYQEATHYAGQTWPKSFLLTYWQRFSCEELVGHAPYLVAQKIELTQPLRLNEAYLCSLQRVRVEQKKQGQLWHYDLRFFTAIAGEFACCTTTLYLKEVRK